MSKEVFISVDVETSGPIPGEYSLLQIGACTIYKNAVPFQCLIKPLNWNAVPAALAVTGLKMDILSETGLNPEDAMEAFLKWIRDAAEGGLPVFVGFNAPFDWSFINYYFHRYLGENPFGISGVDIKALYMGATECAWGATTSEKIATELGVSERGDHTALKDAQFQAELFRRIMNLP